VFLNKRGRPWTTNAIRLQIHCIRLKMKLAADVTAYMLRHTFGTKAVLNGVDVATVAELMGHVDTKMVSAVYVHLADPTDHLTAAAFKAAGNSLGGKPVGGESKA
jgi:site-specific recombinase XerD